MDNKDALWQQERERVLAAAERQPPGIEEGILEVVVGLNALGVETMYSCEGHADGGRPYPWVKIKPGAEGRLAVLLQGFYGDPNEGPADPDVRLVAEQEKYLRPKTSLVFLRGQGSGALDRLPKEILTLDVRASVLARYRTEMDRFAGFLRQTFFEAD